MLLYYKLLIGKAILGNWWSWRNLNNQISGLDDDDFSNKQIRSLTLIRAQIDIHTTTGSKITDRHPQSSEERA